MVIFSGRQIQNNSKFLQLSAEVAVFSLRKVCPPYVMFSLTEMFSLMKFTCTWCRVPGWSLQLFKIEKADGTNRKIYHTAWSLPLKQPFIISTLRQTAKRVSFTAVIGLREVAELHNSLGIGWVGTHLWNLFISQK